MVKEPFFIILILLGIVTIAQKWSTQFQRSFFMRLLPTPVWCYIPPTILTTAGILPASSSVYDWIARYVLPACLILLLMTTDLKGLRKVGGTALIAMAVSTVSVIVGGVCVHLIYQRELGLESWKAIATLAASWIGGTVNQIAVKEATGLSEEIFTPLFISDITIVYIWMMFLMMASSIQKKIDQFLHAKRAEMDEALVHAGPPPERSQTVSMRSLLLTLLIGFGIGTAAIWIGEQIPEGEMGRTSSTWIIILVTTVGLILSQTRFSKREGASASKVGYFLLYLVLAQTGAKANLTAILTAPIFLAIGLIWLAVHFVILLVAGRVFRIPSAMLATASQANLGGVASAPVVASTYEPKLVPIALILAILGSAIANYLAILTGQLLQVLK